MIDDPRYYRLLEFFRELLNNAENFEHSFRVQNPGFKVWDKGLPAAASQIRALHAILQNQPPELRSPTAGKSCWKNLMDLPEAPHLLEKYKGDKELKEILASFLTAPRAFPGEGLNRKNKQKEP